MHALPRNPQGLAVDVVLLVVDTVEELLVDELLVELVVGGGVDVDVVAGGAMDVVVDPGGGFVVEELVDVVVGCVTVLLVVAVGRLLVVVGMVGAFVVEVLGCTPVVVVVVLVPTMRAGHALGAGALRATKRPGLSLPIVPPKRKQ